MLEEYFINARNNANSHHPRNVVNGTPLLHPITNTTTGRYCFNLSCCLSCDILREGSHSDLESYGPGVTNYFKFIKWCFGIFLVLIVTYSPTLVFNIYASSYSNLVLDLSKTTVGNLRYFHHSFSISLLNSKANIALLYSLLVALSCISILFGILWLRFFERKELVYAHVLTVADYTVEASNFPNNIILDENDLKNHIVAVTGHRVVDVVIAYNIRSHIQMLKYRGTLVKQQFHLVNDYLHQSSLTENSRKDIQAAREIAQQKLNKISAEINDIGIKVNSRNDAVVPLKAFVTFEQPLENLRELSKLHNSSYQGIKLNVRPAPEPASIIWENLQCWSLQKIVGWLFTSLVLILLLVITVGAFLFTNMLGMQFVSIGVLLACSLCIEPLLRILIEYELHTNKDGLERSLFWKLFLFKFIITGCSFLLLQSPPTETESSSLLDVAATVKAYCPRCVFATAWFDNVTLSVVLVQLGEIIIPHVFKALSYCNFKWRVSRIERSRTSFILTQDELIDIFMGPEFVLCHRYAQLLSTFFVCLMYAAGIPLLVVIAMINFTVSYWVDKLLFLRFYRSPIRFCPTVSSQASGVMVLSVLLHLAISIWILNQEDIFSDYSKVNYFYQNYNNVYDKFRARHALSKLHILILFLLGLATMVILLIYTLLTYLRACCCCCLSSVRED